MEIFLWIIVVFIALVIIGKLIGDPDIEKLDVARLKREILATQNWINTYHKGGCPPKYKEKFQYKQSRLEQANTQLDKLTSGQTTKSGDTRSIRPEDAESDVSPELASDENYQDFLIVDSMRQLTDLASSQGLIQPEEKSEYWRIFKDRIRNVHLRGKSATLHEVEAAIEKELNPVFQSSLRIVSESAAQRVNISEELALAKCVVNWYQREKNLAQIYADSQENEEQEYLSKSKSGRAHDSGDYVKAAELYLKEAEQGEVAEYSPERVAAQVNLSSFYEHGRGIPQDYVQAYMWKSIVLSTTTNHPFLAESLNKLAGKMTADQIAEAQELARKRIANNFKLC